MYELDALFAQLQRVRIRQRSAMRHGLWEQLKEANLEMARLHQKIDAISNAAERHDTREVSP